MDIFGSSYFVTPLLSASVHAGIEVCVVKDDGVCIKHSPNCRAASIGQDAAEHLPVPVKFLHALLQGNKHRPFEATMTKVRHAFHDSIFFSFNCHGILKIPIQVSVSLH